METAIKTFEIGQTYTTRSIGDSDCIIAITVAARTKSTITTTEGKRFGIIKKSTEWNKAETIKPWGTYSMSPSIQAK